MTSVVLIIFSALLALTTGAPCNALAADPGPVGEEFLAAGRVVPDETFEFRSCFDGAGNSYRLNETTSDPTDPARQVFVERKDPAARVAKPTRPSTPKSAAARPVGYPRRWRPAPSPRSRATTGPKPESIRRKERRGGPGPLRATRTRR